MPTIPIRPLTAEVTVICKGMEMTHGNSDHYMTFELDSGERLCFQVSMKLYMLFVEGDRCVITYRRITTSPKKRLKAIERIGVKSFVVSNSIEGMQEEIEEDEMEDLLEAQYSEQEVESPPEEITEETKSTTEIMQQRLEESRKSLAVLRERQAKEEN